MKVWGITVGGNEKERYLDSFLLNVARVVDGLFYYDDQSTDGSLETVQFFADHTGKVMTYRRGDDVPGFMEHEGKFRQDSWTQFERHIQPTTNDWVLAIDTDECLVGPTDCRPCDLKPVLERATNGVVLLDRPEVWGYKGDWPLVRKDGYWGGIKCTRLFQYQTGGKIKDVVMGCGSEPTYINNVRNPTPGAPLQLLHFGYVHPDDRWEKYYRYRDLPGHSPQHISSIIGDPVLEEWQGLIPPDMKRAT